MVMKASVIGYPRVGAARELKFATERYFRNEAAAEELQAVAARLRATHWRAQQGRGIDFIASNDFSFYDQVLDTAVLFNVIPGRFRRLELSDLDRYFAMARGYQGPRGDVKALSMRKWFNTNYHYIVPEIGDHTELQPTGAKPFDEYREARNLGIETKPVLIGPFTFLKLARFTGRRTPGEFVNQAARAYAAVLRRFRDLGTQWVQFDEPALVTDLAPGDLESLDLLYNTILSEKGNVKVLLQTYFGDIRDCYREIAALPFDGIGLDFVEGKQTLALIRNHGFPAGKTLFAGVVNGKNVWRNNYADTVRLIGELGAHSADIVVGTSCSLLHVPYTLQNETGWPDRYTRHLAFAAEKLTELSALKRILDHPNPAATVEYRANQSLCGETRDGGNASVRAAVSALRPDDFIRRPDFEKRAQIQKAAFNLPLLPTTTIGSFPQTADVKRNRADFKHGRITVAQYTALNRAKIREWVLLQEEIGLDVLVHGEFERNDMVEYFAEHLDGFLFTTKGWVQSYGTRCVKPPIIWGDIRRTKPITVDYAVYTQSLTSQYVKGMLTGPVTILNWSFPREDISLRDCAFQIALAIRDEVRDLEANGIRIIQVDEAALREKLPIRRSDWHNEYLDWAIPAFRLVHSGVRPETQIHTHMCYSEFTDIIREIDAMDADAISFEAARSDLSIVETLKESGFKTAVGPGVYDIHSPRIPSVPEIEEALLKMLAQIPKQKLWVNPDCGLKTRGKTETVPSLKNLVAAAKNIRRKVGGNARI